MEYLMSSSALTDSDKKYWPPVETVVQYLCNKIPEGAKVLEIGPGYVPFPRATMSVDYRPVPVETDKLISLDLDVNKLPFEDKSFDFIYCRHVLEDMYNPFPLIDEMSRVGKAGYVETPSPIAELTRGVDGASPPFRGYHHHRYVVWNHEGELRLIAKYPIIEYVRFSEEMLADWLRQGPKLWNTYLLWQDRINWKHIKSGPDFVITRDYSKILKDAMDQSAISGGAFFTDIPDKVEIGQGALPNLTQPQTQKVA
jgi:hypothetical protein